jgi:ribonuclease HII
MLTIGIDDAGRGPIMGPMILAGVLVDDKIEKSLKKYPIKDSKQLTHPKRIELSKIIKEHVIAFHIEKTTPVQIDTALTTGTNLNTLEAIKTAEIINALNKKTKKIKVIVDCPSTNTLAWKKTLISFVEHPSNLDISCEHKADVNHLPVSAASIIAKVQREEEVEKIKKEFGSTGSGYTSDPYTIEFLKQHGKRLKNSGIFRKTWQTWKNMFPEAEKGQATLDKF